jgi:hypothetical protein
MLFHSLVLMMGLLLPGLSIADVKQDIGYTELASILGSSLPDGASVSVLQVEAGVNFAPDTTNAQFVGKTIQDLSSPPSSGPSSHATGVGSRFYGLNSSISPAISDISIYGADSFLFDFLNFGSSTVPEQLPSRVANHSWVGGYLVDSNGDEVPASTSNLLRRIDWLIDEDEFIHVAAPDNAVSGIKPLVTSAYNVITVGRTSGVHLSTVSSIDSIYVAGRPAVHLVVPESTTSGSAPYASSAAVLLIDAAHANSAWSQGSTSNRSGATIYNAERSETIKAALMAGASRFTYNSSTTANIEDYRVDTANQTDNGLDWRYGAGQLNINNSYSILAAGEQASIQEGGSISPLMTGFDYVPKFGGRRGSDTVAEYNLGTATGNQFFAASLVWHLDVGGGSSFFSSLATFRNLDLYLVDTTGGANTIVASSLSSIDNTENVWFELIAGHDYQIRVESLGADFEWDYSLAWQAVDFVDSDDDGVFDHLDSDVQDPCVPTVFVSACNADSDNDGLTDFTEGETADTDLDGELDYLESNVVDSDGDGTVDQLDVANSDPCIPTVFVSACNTDSDNDGLTDFEEGEAADTDGDGVLDYEESNLLDEDGDGLVDQQDMSNGDPCVPTVFVLACGTDTDDDGLTDFAEGEATDTDGDGVLDYVESNLLDDDGDGFSNQVDIWNDDSCMPDASQCTYDIPMLTVIGQVLLALSLLVLFRHVGARKA